MANTPAPENNSESTRWPPLQFAPVKQFDPVKAMQVPGWQEAAGHGVQNPVLAQHQANSQDKCGQAVDGAWAAHPDNLTGTGSSEGQF